MTTEMTTGTEDTPGYPETVEDCDDHGDTRQLASEGEERDPEEAGYGYGV